MAELSVADGTYVILNAKNPTNALDSKYATDDNGQALWLYPRNDSDGQLIRVWTRPDGTRQLCFAATGKCVDVRGGVIADGSIIQQYDANDTTAQQWDIEPVEDVTITLGEESFQVYNIWLHALGADESRFLLDVAGHNGGKADACWLWHADGDQDQQWIFVSMAPIPLGTYVIHPRIDTSLAIDVSGSSKASGANVMISGSHVGSGVDSGNNQVVWLREFDETGQAKLYFCHSFLILEVAKRKGTAHSGDNVVQSKDDSGADQSWVVTPHGTTTYNGVVVPCYTLHNVAAEGDTLCLDVSGGRRSPGTNLQLWTRNNTAAQDFYFEPTEMVAANLPVPVLTGVFASGKRPSSTCAANGTTSWQFGWSCQGTDWQGRYRYRTRRLGHTIGEFGSWCSITDGSAANSGWGTIWQPNVTTIDTPQKESPIVELPAVDNTTYDLIEVEYEIRRFEADYDERHGLYAHGNSRSMVCTLAWLPTVTITAMGWSPDGFLISYESDYRRGGNTITVDSIMVSDNDGTRTDALSSTYTLTAMPHEGTITVPIDNMSAIPGDGDSCTIKLTFRSDELTVHPTISGTILWDASHGITVTPNYLITDRDTLLVTVATHDTDEVWLKTDKVMEQCQEISATAQERTFEVIPPTNTPFEVCIVSRAGSSWGTNVDKHEPIRESGYIWNWIDTELGRRAALLYVGLGKPLTMNDTGQPQYTRIVTTGRAYPVYRFGESEVRDLSVSGLVTEDEPRAWCTLAAMDELKHIHHALFRDPRGNRHYVAVLEVSKPIQRADYTEVSIKQEEEMP